MDTLNRPDWTEYFLSFAILAASRSPDQRTKCGCVFVKDKKIIAIGYNGFPAGVEDEKLPNYGPDKYWAMIHAEMNAIYNATTLLKDSVAYISGPPCSECMKAMWQCGMRQIHYCDWSKPNMEYDKENREKVVALFNHIYTFNADSYCSRMEITKHDVPTVVIEQRK